MKRSKSSRILKILSYVLLITGMIVILYPFYLTIIIGINNVNTRIKNYYGEKYGVKVNKADKGTEIQLLLGIENLEEENKDK